MYDLLALALYATIVTGVAIVSLLVNYVQIKRLPEIAFAVGMAIRDQTMDEFGIPNPNGKGAQGGRPAEGGMGMLLHYAEKFGIIDKLMGKATSGVAAKTFNPGMR